MEYVGLGTTRHLLFQPCFCKCKFQQIHLPLGTENQEFMKFSSTSHLGCPKVLWISPLSTCSPASTPTALSSALPLFPCTWWPRHTEKWWSLEGVLLFCTSSLAAGTCMGLLTSLPPPHPWLLWGDLYSPPPSSHQLIWLPPLLPSHLACTLDSDDRSVLFLYITLSNHALRHFILLIPPPPHSPYLTQRLTCRKCSVLLNTWRDIFFFEEF